MAVGTTNVTSMAVCAIETTLVPPRRSDPTLPSQPFAGSLQKRLALAAEAGTTPTSSSPRTRCRLVEALTQLARLRGAASTRGRRPAARGSAVDRGLDLARALLAVEPQAASAAGQAAAPAAPEAGYPPPSRVAVCDVGLAARPAARTAPRARGERRHRRYERRARTVEPRARRHLRHRRLRRRPLDRAVPPPLTKCSGATLALRCPCHMPDPSARHCHRRRRPLDARGRARSPVCSWTLRAVTRLRVEHDRRRRPASPHRARL